MNPLATWVIVALLVAALVAIMLVIAATIGRHRESRRDPVPPHEWQLTRATRNLDEAKAAWQNFADNYRSKR